MSRCFGCKTEFSVLEKFGEVEIIPGVYMKYCSSCLIAKEPPLMRVRELDFNSCEISIGDSEGEIIYDISIGEKSAAGQGVEGGEEDNEAEGKKKLS